MFTLEKVDVVDLETLKTGFDGIEDVLPVEALLVDDTKLVRRLSCVPDIYAVVLHDRTTELYSDQPGRMRIREGGGVPWS